MTDELKGCTAVVTGAGSGFGAALVDRFREAGMKIAALDIDGSAAQQVADRVGAQGGEAMGLRVDVADAGAVQAAAEAVADRFGNCSILCANVGVQQFGPLERLTEQEWRWVLDVNVMGTIHTVQSFLPLIRRSKGPKRILVTSSSAALTPGIRMGAYTASKYAVTGYAETLRMELAEEGIGVSIAFPAGMATRHLESSALARPREMGEMEIRRDDIDAMMKSRGMTSADHVATAEHAARNILPDLLANERYIVTHGAYRAQLEETFDALLKAHDRGQDGPSPGT